MSKTRPDNLMKNDNMFMSFARIFIAIVAMIFMGILTVSAFLGTTGMEHVEGDKAVDSVVFRIREGIESVIYYNDGIIGNIIWLAFCLLICFLMLPLLKKVPVWAECLFVAAWTITLGVIWVQSSKCCPTEDSYWVTEAALQFRRGDYHTLNEWYFQDYSFQLGMVLFNELMIILHTFFLGEPKNILFMENVNVVMLAAAYVGMIIMNSLIFKDKRVHHMTALLLLFAAQPVIFCSFLYGIIPGMCFAVYAMLFLVLYLQRNRLHWGILSALCIALAVTIKSNNNIVLVAICGVIFVAMFKRKKFVKDIIIAVLAVTLSVSIMPIIKSSYEKRSGYDMGDHIPFISWFYMGLHEAGNGPGWYSPYYTLGIFDENDRDAAKTSEAVKEKMKERIGYLLENPQYRNAFFYKKFMSQWNETSYQSIWNNQVRWNLEPRGKIAVWVCGDGEMRVKSYMDIYAQLIFVAVMAGLVGCLKNRNFLSIMMPLVVLGGMMYHLIAEAKSQYAIPYFILMMGFAGYGICVLYDYLAKKTEGNPVLSFFFVKEKEPVPVLVGAGEPVETADTAEPAETAVAEAVNEAAETNEDEEEETADESADMADDEEKNDDENEVTEENTEE